MTGTRRKRSLALAIFVVRGLIVLLASSQAAPVLARQRDDLAAARQAHANAAAGSAERQTAAVKLGILLLRRATHQSPANDRAAAPDLSEAETLFREAVAGGGEAADGGEGGLLAVMLARGPSGAADANGEIQRLQQSSRSADLLLCVAMHDLLSGNQNRETALAASDLINDHVHALLPTAPYLVSTRVSRPEKLFAPAPQYTAEARKKKLRGHVLFQAVIDSEGHVADLLVLEPGPFTLTDAAAKTVRGWTFRPALLADKAVPVCYQPGIGFNVQ